MTRTGVRSRSSRYGLLKLALAAGLGSVLSFGCNTKPETQVAVPDFGQALPANVPREVHLPGVRFTDITARSGIRFQHTNGAFGKKLLPETMGSGVAFLDYDRDGRPDILFVNSYYWPGHEGPTRPTLALYRNKGDGTFEDVTEAVGLNVTLYGMGVAVGDYDNDGWPDVFITALGGCRLFRNIQGKRFEDVTQAAGVAGPTHWPTAAEGEFLQRSEPISWPTSATFLDYDGDGRLDLFVCHYVTWSPDFDLKQPFQLKGEGRAYGPPTVFDGAQCILYRNLGNGKFQDVSREAGIQVFDREGVGPQARLRSVGKSLGVYACDVDGDGWPDIIVANDTVRNFFFHNRRDGTFEEIGLLSGIGLAGSTARGGMGIDGACYRPDRFGVVVANYAEEPDTLLRQHKAGGLLFSDAALAEGIAGPSRQLLKFGTLFFDYDNDGRPDLLTCNGHLEPEINKVEPGQTYAQPAQLFWNCTGSGAGKASFMPITEKEAGPDLFQPMVGRGAAFASITGDGCLDVVLTANGGPARLLKNGGGTGHNWIRLALEGDGVHSNRSALGARVTLEAGGRIQRQQVTGGRGYLSQSEPTLTFGLGKAAKVDRVTIEWHGRNAGKEVRTNLAVNKLHVIQQGK